MYRFRTLDGYTLQRVLRKNLPEELQDKVSTDAAWTDGDLVFSDIDGEPVDASGDPLEGVMEE